MARARNPLISEEERQRRALYNKRYLERIKARNAINQEENKTMTEVIENKDYKKEYDALVKETNTLKAKLAEYEKLIASFSEKEKINSNNMRKAAMEYSARINFMMDAVKHAYMSIQFAAAAPELKGE